MSILNRYKSLPLLLVIVALVACGGIISKKDQDKAEQDVKEAASVAEGVVLDYCNTPQELRQPIVLEAGQIKLTIQCMGDK